MWRERGLRVLLVLVGLLFTAGVYPLIGSLLHPADSDTGDTMMLSLYVALGVFLLIAARNPWAHRSLIAFAAWSSFAHAVVMSVLGLEIASEPTGFPIGSAVLVAIGVALIVLAPGNESGRLAPSAGGNCRNISISLIDRGRFPRGPRGVTGKVGRSTFTVAIHLPRFSLTGPSRTDNMVTLTLAV